QRRGGVGDGPFVLGVGGEPGPFAGPAAHRAVKKGKGSNRLLVVVRGRRLEVYVNGEAVCEPVTLDRDVTPATVGLCGRALKEKSRVEFERLTIWRAADLRR